MCCLKHEQNAYESLLKMTPKQGAIVSTPDGRGTVVDLNLLTENQGASGCATPDAAPSTYEREQVKTIRDKAIKVDKKELKELSDLEG